jgi:hypothetical protein
MRGDAVSWREQAACLNTLKVEVFFDRDPTIALEVCRRCPVKMACREDADATETPNSTHGVRGGETEGMRLDRRSQPGRYRRRRSQEHGTPKGYRSHKAFDEPACPACAAAWKDYCRIVEARRAPRPHRRSTGRPPSLPLVDWGEVAS